jgi:hypothetical protein
MAVELGGLRAFAELQRSAARTAMHLPGQAKSSSRQAESLLGGAVRARSLGRSEDFPLAHPDGAESDAREERPRHEHEVDQRDGEGNQGGHHPGPDGAGGSRQSLAQAQPLDYQLGSRRRAAESLEWGAE